MTTLSKFAKLTDLTPGMASRLLNGNRCPSVASASRIAKAFSFTDEELREWLKVIDEGGPVASGVYLKERVTNARIAKPVSVPEDRHGMAEQDQPGNTG